MTASNSIDISHLTVDLARLGDKTYDITSYQYIREARDRETGETWIEGLSDKGWERVQEIV